MSQPVSSTPETFRSVELTKIGANRFKATNARGGETYFGSGGEDPDFTPVSYTHLTLPTIYSV